MFIYNFMKNYIIFPTKQMKNNNFRDASVNNINNEECINFDDMDLCMNTFNKGKFDQK